jgi:hypothetical protein
LGVLVAPAPNEAETSAADRSHSDNSAVLRHADYPGRRWRNLRQFHSVFTKEDEGYHTEASRLNAFHHMPPGNFAQTCDAIPSMKLAVGIAALILIVLSFFADYQWKHWIAARKQERDQQK